MTEFQTLTTRFVVVVLLVGAASSKWLRRFKSNRDDIC